MSLGVPRVRRMRDPGDPPRWEMARALPHPELRAWVEGYAGYWERADGPLVRRELPVPKAVLIIDFGPLLRILDPGSPEVAHAHVAGFVAGLSESFTLTQHVGFSQGIQIDLTPLGAHRLAGVPAHQLTGAVIGLDDVFGASGPALTERLQETAGWELRFDVLDEFLRARLQRSRPIPRHLVHALRRIVDTRGAVPITALARELEVSRKHLVAGFHEHVGLAPKLFAQIVRFDAALQRVLADARSGTRVDWARRAADAGYYDQAHLVRDVRRFSGYTPAELVRHLLPDLGGVG